MTEQIVDPEVYALRREVKRLTAVQRMASRHASQRDVDLAEAEAIIAARDAEIARFNAREMRVRLELRDGRDEAADLRDRLKATSNACNDAENRLDTMTEVARGNKRHVAYLTALIERVTALTLDEDGKPKDPALVLYVGDLNRALVAQLTNEQGSPPAEFAKGGRINSPVDGDHPSAWTSGCVIASGVFGTKGPITPTLEENAMTETTLDVDEPLPGMPEPQPPAPLWALHIAGSDDIVAMPSSEVADGHKAVCDATDRRTAGTPNVVLLAAKVVPWTGSREDHAAALAEGQ